MTLIFEKRTKGAGTHALIVASGDIPRYPEAGTGAGVGGGRWIANWLVERFRNPAAELASVDFLAAAPEKEIRYPFRGETASIIEPPRYESLKAALKRWRGRLDSDAGNIAFFYYAGYVFHTSETLLPLQNFADGAGGAVSLPSLLATMRGCRADRHLYIVDGIPLPFGSAVEGFQARSLGAPSRRDVPHWAAIHGETAVSRSDPVTGFARALIGILEDPRRSKPISVKTIDLALRQKLSGTAVRMLGSQITGDFDFHHPFGLEPAPEYRAYGGEPANAAEMALAPIAAAAPSAKGSAAKTSAAGPSEPSTSAPPPRKAAARGKAPRTEPSVAEATTDFVPDDAEAERDALGRSVLAIGLARRLHKIWRQANDPAAPAAAGDRAAFVVHLDGPWGGGKTSFANFLGRVLNPCPPGRPAAWFLRERYPDRDLGGIFLDDPPPDAAAAAALAALPDDDRRPWIVVGFNAWQAEHCTPPWWVFYQAIRTGCLDAIRIEGDGAWAPRPPGPRPRWRAWLGRRWRAIRGKGGWLYLAVREYLWRLGNPKLQSVLVTAALGSVVLLGLSWMGLAFDLTGSLGLLSGGLAALWGLAAFFTESVAPGTGTVAERLSLGGGDPFARFRVHFSRMMERVRRPVLVIVDDLDRCRPDFVVDLIRGIQTLLRSPRVVFLILGDRDWIERAFEAHHEAMKTVDVGPEQTFGARFVEKAIQMSFILPALGDERRLGYVRKVLLGDRAAGAAAEAPIEPQAAARVREIVNRAAAAPGADPFDTAPIVDQVRTELKQAARASGATIPIAGIAIERMVSETLAIRATTDDKVEQEVVHELQRLARCFPANPRQVKRIVNAVTIYYAVALQRPGLVPDAAYREQLALWVIVMTEWPETWRLLASFPDLVDLLNDADPKAMEKPGLKLPGSFAATARALDRIRADPELMALIAGGGESGHAPLRTPSVRSLAELTPLHSRRRRLTDADEAPIPAKAESASRAKAKPAKPGA